MIDQVEKCVERIKKELSQARIREFSNKSLNATAEIFESDGPTVAEWYVKEKIERRDETAEMEALLRVLELMKEYPVIQRRRPIGRLIIKTLNVLLRESQTEKQKRGVS